MAKKREKRKREMIAKMREELARFYQTDPKREAYLRRVRRRYQVNAKPNKYYLDVTYQVISQESAEHGEYADSGYQHEDLEFDFLAAVALYIKEHGGVEFSGSDWWNTVDPERDYATGDEIYYSFHPKNLEVAEFEILMRYMKIPERELRKVISDLEDKFYG